MNSMKDELYFPWIKIIALWIKKYIFYMVKNMSIVLLYVDHLYGRRRLNLLHPEKLIFIWLMIDQSS